MKKIITLILSAGLFTATYAQGHKDYFGRNDRKIPNSYAKNNKALHNRNVYRTNSFQKQRQVEKIDREFKYKVMAIQQNRHMTNRQKRLSIRDAKNERNYKMQMIKNNSSGYANSNYKNDQWR